MGAEASKEIPNGSDFFVAENGHGDKFANMGYISLGFFLTWIVFGTILAFYVRSQIDPNEAKMRSSHTW